MNFALTLTVWDYLFGTAYVPTKQAHLPLGWPGVAQCPATFVAQQLEPFSQLRPRAASAPLPGRVLAAGATPLASEK
ncbi:hypothetical protein [Hymenobacter antarcticus]|uniref:Uncharacterized protein n=1 Tax=Hymenobacter antarcticus TaxID=486270 RepID=A0ABP7Q5C7_9BACT